MNSPTRTLLLTLIKARTLIGSEETWLARGYAADANGKWTPFGSKEAVRFTVLGAIMRATAGSTEHFVDARSLFSEVAPLLFAKLTSSNGSLTYQESLTILDIGIGALLPKHASGFTTAVRTPPTGVRMEDLERSRGLRRG